MHKGPVPGYDTDLYIALDKELIEPAIAVTPEQGLDLWRDLIESFFHCHLPGMSGDGNVIDVQVAVADHLHLGDLCYFLANQLKDGTSEIACNAPVAACPL